MKKGTVLNADISSVISRLGHTDTLVVCDAGLPVPRSSARIDMALTHGVPSFMQVLEVVTSEMQVEKRNRRQSGGDSQRGVFPVCERYSLCRRDVLRSPIWKPYCN